MLTYTKYLLAILSAINMCSCKPKPAILKEVIYKNYSFAQLKGYLGGKWILIDSASNDTLLTPFTFTYKPKSDTSGYMNPTTRLEYHVTFFDLRKDQNDYFIQYTPYMPSPNRKFYKIKKISNLEFVVEVDKHIVVYKKLPGN
jgi:hypothetical protein